jgi:glycosyltransferase involved in cell wall biosynthesis
MVQKTINLCFVYPEGDGWTGEANYLDSLISSLSLLKLNKLNFLIFCSYKKKKHLSSFIPNKNIIASIYFEKNSIFLVLRKIIKLIFKMDLILLYLLKKNKVNILSHHVPTPGITSICWIPDLQHHYLKSFFSKLESKRRNLLFNNYIKKADAVIVSSKDTYANLKKNYKINNSKTHILNFVPKIDFSVIKNFETLKKKYNLDPNYIYVPNQFWKHKNHIILVKSAIILKQKNYRVKFVITGNPASEINNITYSDFVKNIAVNQVNEYFDLLGFVPYEDVINLIYHSKILLNPSLFEGWSTTVEEGKVFNKKMILSNIKVHKEQCSSKAVYFKRNNPTELAKKIIQLSKVKNNYQKISIIKKNYKKSRISFAKNYLKIIESVV